MTGMIEPVERPRPESSEPFAAAPDLYVYGDVLDEIRFNGRWRKDGLAGGLLVGRYFRDPDGGEYGIAEGFVGGTHSDDLDTFGRALRSGWKSAIAERAVHLPDAQILGWYVAPGDGERRPDRAALLLHNTFFNHPWQLGLWVAPDARPVTLRPAGETFEEGVVAVVDRAGAHAAHAP